MKKNLSLLFALIGWFAVLTQFYLMMDNRVASVAETIIRFFSFFTILTNSLVAVYFTYQYSTGSSSIKSFFDKAGVLTAICLYITIVGLVYQIVLRHIWEPTGMQMLVDELLHSVIPILTIFYWFRYENKREIQWGHLPYILIYPLIYLVYILVRGSFSGFYPYPFVNVTELGLNTVLFNSGILLIVFVVMAAALIGLGKLIHRKTV